MTVNYKKMHTENERIKLNAKRLKKELKLLIEENLKWYSQMYGLKYVALRYFNAAGYDVDKKVVGKEKRAHNLIPLIIEVAKGMKPFIPIYGNDYLTKDGTGVRDYVHVTDLASAHLSSLYHLRKNNG